MFFSAPAASALTSFLAVCGLDLPKNSVILLFCGPSPPTHTLHLVDVPYPQDSRWSGRDKVMKALTHGEHSGAKTYRNHLDIKT